MESETRIKNILVSVDGSETCLAAQVAAATLAKKTKAKVYVLHVIQSTRSYLDLPVDMNVPTSIYDDVYANLRQRAETIVSSAQVLFKNHGVNVETEIVREDDVANVILEKAQTGFELIVMGGRGEDEKERYALGSVAKKVVIHTDTPTLIIKKSSTLSNMLVCINGSERSAKALHFAAAIAKTMGSKITLLNVQESLLGEKSQQVAKEISQRISSRVIESLRDADLKVDSKMVFGVPSNRILDVAHKGDYDLIVLSKKGSGTITRFLLGSTSDAVTYKSKRSVLLVPA
jgi:nucleotide-binding universal stress UspA family protein